MQVVELLGWETESYLGHSLTYEIHPYHKQLQNVGYLGLTAGELNTIGYPPNCEPEEFLSSKRFYLVVAAKYNYSYPVEAAR